MNDDRFCIDDFELYKLAREFRKKIYRLAKELPADEKYILFPQMRAQHYQFQITSPRVTGGGSIRIMRDFAELREGRSKR